MDKTKSQRKNEKKRASKWAKTPTREESEQKNLESKFAKPASTVPSRDTSGESDDFDAKNLRLRIEAANKSWPWGVKCPPKLVTQAPFAANEFNHEKGYFKLPAAKQTCALFRLDVGLIYQILESLFQHHGPASKFAATCQKAFAVTSQFIDHWDISRSNFLLCDQEDMNGSGVEATVGKVVVVSPFRNRMYAPGNHDIELYALQHMTLAINNFADRFEVLHLHRIPMLTVEVLALIIPKMRNLRMIGIYRCELLHLASALPILEILRDNRGAGKTTNIAFDFYPRFHVGPANLYDHNARTGSYGVTWDNFELDSRLGIWALVDQILSVAMTQGVDFTSEHTAFRLWLEQSPCWNVKETLESITRGKDRRIILSFMGSPYSRCTAASGEGFLPTFICERCRLPIHRLFFDMWEWRPYEWGHSRGMTCLGCKLGRYLECESDHRKQQKQKLVAKWLTKADGEPNVDDIDYALDVEVRTKARSVAKNEEGARRRELTERNGKEESQRPPQKGMRYSPVVGSEAKGYW